MDAGARPDAVRRLGRLRLEPWGVGYAGSVQDGGAFGDDEGEEPGSERELTARALSVEVPLSGWRPLRPVAPARVSRVLFLDGVRRVEARAVLEGEGLTFGAFGSCAVGAVMCDLTAEKPIAWLVGDPVVERWCVIATTDVGLGGDVTVTSAPGAPLLRFRLRAAEGSEWQAPVDGLQALMREAERRVAAGLRGLMAARDGEDGDGRTSLLVCDGPRPFLGSDDRVIGYLKTIKEQRLPAAALDVVKRLEGGQRSPLYLVGDGAHARFEWYLRLRDPRPWLHSLAGSVRLQAHAGEDPLGQLAAAKAVADWSAAELPRFATRAHQDPRAPQQLLPVRALESTLRRRLGSGPLLRRRIEVALARQGDGVA